MTAYYSEFAGTTVLVTGAGAGIGRTIAHAFLEHGARVAGLDIDEQGLAATFGGASLPEVCAVKCDVSDEGQLRFAFEAVVGALGAPSILINNAGVGVAAPFEEISAASWRKALALNLDHQFLLSQLAVPHMRRLGRGSIVNLSSHAWMKMAPNLSGYHAAKAGLVAYSCRSKCSFRPPGVRRPRGFFLPMLNADGVGYRSR
jgi:NAD(P)-dependent dehydrogenase (short-subunit alcohol dehydrogenase family)